MRYSSDPESFPGGGGRPGRAARSVDARVDRDADGHSRSADECLAGSAAVLRQACDVLAGIDPSELSEAGLGDALLDLLQVRRQVEGAIAAVGHRFAHSNSWAADGARDATGWVRGRTQEGFGSARRVFTTANECAVFDQMGDALRRGEISLKHVTVLGEVARTFPRLQGHLKLAQPQIVALAAEREPAAFARALTEMCHRLDPIAAQEDAKTKEREYYLRASTLMDGAVRLDAMLPADVGQLLMASLEAARRVVAQEDDADADADGDGAINGADRDADGSGGPDQAGVECGWLEKFGVPHQPITPDTTRRLACDATLRPLLMNTDGNLVAFGTASRVLPPAMRALVVRRDIHCRFAGCRARIDEVHHLIYYSRGGLTRSDNLIGLCWHHHHLVHEGGWQLSGDPNHEVTGTGPDGRTWTTGPPGYP